MDPISSRAPSLAPAGAFPTWVRGERLQVHLDPHLGLGPIAAPSEPREPGRGRGSRVPAGVRPALGRGRARGRWHCLVTWRPRTPLLRVSVCAVGPGRKGRVQPAEGPARSTLEVAPVSAPRVSIPSRPRALGFLRRAPGTAMGTPRTLAPASAPQLAGFRRPNRGVPCLSVSAPQAACPTSTRS